LSGPLTALFARTTMASTLSHAEPAIRPGYLRRKLPFGSDPVLLVASSATGTRVSVVLRAEAPT
jgi:hypothetical protein